MASAVLRCCTLRALTELGFDVFGLETRYGTPEFQALPDAVAGEWLTADVRAAWHAARSARPYQELCVVSKSLGSVGLQSLLTEGQVPVNARLVG